MAEQSMRTEIPDIIYDAIKSLSTEGDALAHAQDYAEAINHYQKAWSLLPEPRNQWLASAWLLAAIGDARYQSNDYSMALCNFTDAILAPEGLGNPFLHLRRGECLFELGDKKGAADELIRAYMGAGEEIFNTEDPKYLQYLGTVAEL